jgi:hypothetical protein
VPRPSVVCHGLGYRRTRSSTHKHKPYDRSTATGTRWPPGARNGPAGDEGGVPPGGSLTRRLPRGWLDLPPAVRPARQCPWTPAGSRGRPWRAASRGPGPQAGRASGVLAQRTPMFSFLFVGLFLLRLDARTLFVSLFQPPPRNTRACSGSPPTRTRTSERGTGSKPESEPGGGGGAGAPPPPPPPPSPAAPLVQSRAEQNTLFLN